MNSHRLILVAAVLLCGIDAAVAEVVGTTARVSTTVQELIVGQPGSVNADAVETPSELPLIASAALDTTELDGTRSSIGQGFSVFEDPARLDEANPQEFALETACYSNAPDVSYLVDGNATETRTVVFSREELNPGAVQSSREVVSRVFLSGAVIFWSQTPVTGSDDLGADVAFRVTRDDGAEELFATSLSVAAAGETLATGPIVFETVGLGELASLVDETTLAILHQLEEDGELTVIAISQQEHEYEYTATVDEPIALTATLEVQVRNAPAGTGVAAVMGRPFQELADFIEEALPGTDGDALQRSLNKSIARRNIGLVPSADAPPAPATRSCGAMDGWAFVMFAFVVRAPLSRRRS